LAKGVLYATFDVITTFFRRKSKPTAAGLSEMPVITLVEAVS
jgi:hypothetical protein